MTNHSYQAIVAAPGFSLGIRCSDIEIIGVEFIEPQAELPAQNALAGEAVRQLRAYITDAGSPLELPLKAAGTPFQRRVWAQISSIPLGETRCYGQLAKSLENAPRAVGQACGANPYPLVVPCHRVISSNGGLGGFNRQRGGFLLDVKRWLLSHEGHQFASQDC